MGFLEKKLKLKLKKDGGEDTQTSQTGKTKLTTLDFGADDDEDDDDDFLKSSKNKSSIIFEESEEEEEGDEKDESKKSSKKPLTKYAVAKRLVKKNLVINKRQMFDDEGDAI